MVRGSASCAQLCGYQTMWRAIQPIPCEAAAPTLWQRGVPSANGRHQGLPARRRILGELRLGGPTCPSEWDQDWLLGRGSPWASEGRAQSLLTLKGDV